jgi:hypothetical protein
MKKLFITAVAVLAFSGSGFAIGAPVVKIKNYGVNCHDFGRGAAWAYYNSTPDPSIETGIAIRIAATAACKAMYNQN